MILSSLLTVVLLVGTALAAPTLSLYSTFHSVGISVDVTTAEKDSIQNTTVLWGTSNLSKTVGHPLVPVSIDSGWRFVGSLFQVNPNTEYFVEVRFGGSGAPSPVHGAITTQDEAMMEGFLKGAPATVLYVSPTGSGTACSQVAPCNLTRGLSSAMPGNEVRLTAGTYYAGSLSPARSGTSVAPILIRGEVSQDGTPLAVLDGSYDTPHSWTDNGNGIWYTQVTEASPHLVAANNIRLFPYSSVANLQSQTEGGDVPGYFFDSSSSRVYVNLKNSPPGSPTTPSSANVKITRRTYAFHITGKSYIYISNLKFQYYGLGLYGNTIYFDGVTNSVVSNCTFFLNDIAFAMKRACSRNVFQYNSVTETKDMWLWEGVKAEGRSEAGASIIYEANPPSFGRGHIFRRNRITGGFDGFNFGGASTAGGLTHEIDVYENVVTNSADDGVEMDGICSNCRVWGNSFSNGLAGISLAPVEIGPIWVFRNFIYNIGHGRSNANYGGLGFKFNVNADPGGRYYLYHNTIWVKLNRSPLAEALAVRQTGAWELIIARNNIFLNNATYCYNLDNTNPLDFDYNLLWNNNWQYIARDNRVALARYADINGLRGVGMELNGLVGNPLLNEDLSLASGSAAIDKGVLIPGINDNYSGAGPDMGAIEFLTAAPPSTQQPPTTGHSPHSSVISSVMEESTPVISTSIKDESSAISTAISTTVDESSAISTAISTAIDESSAISTTVDESTAVSTAVDESTPVMSVSTAHQLVSADSVVATQSPSNPPGPVATSTDGDLSSSQSLASPSVAVPTATSTTASVVASGGVVSSENAPEQTSQGSTTVVMGSVITFSLFVVFLSF